MDPGSSGIAGRDHRHALPDARCAAFIIPVGVASAIYLEEYANREKWINRLIEVDIQNLAAVPSIVYGVLGLAFLVRGPIGLGNVVFAGGLTLGLLSFLSSLWRAGRRSGPFHLPSVRVHGAWRNQMAGSDFDPSFTSSAYCSWSKGIDSSDNHGDDNQGFNAGGNARNYSLLDPKLNRHLSLSDLPHRFVASYLYELPFGEGKKFGKSGLLKHLAGGWQLGGSVIWQSGFPIGISGASTGAALARPDRVDGVDFEVPKDLQRWYDGRTTVTLPSGRRITPPANTFLKYNPDAFAGRVVTTPNGRIVADQFWFGNAQQVYDEIRTDPRFNIDLTIRRSFRITPGMSAEMGADAMNVLNHTQFNGTAPGAWVGNLGATQLTNNPGGGFDCGHRRREQLRHARHDDIQSAADHAARGAAFLRPDAPRTSTTRT